MEGVGRIAKNGRLSRHCGAAGSESRCSGMMRSGAGYRLSEAEREVPGMMTRREKLSVATLLGIAVAGHGVRILAMGPDAPPGGMMVIAGAAPANPMAHRARAEQLARPLAAGQRVDLNRAPAEEIARLPRVSLKMAKTIVRARAAEGGFVGAADLDRVPGVGPGLLAAVAPHVSFGDTARIIAERERQARGQAVAVGRPVPPAPVVVVGKTSQARSGGKSPPDHPIRLNSASQADLERLPGIGPARARAIVAYRQGNGPFASVEDLEKVPGITRRLVRQLASQVAIR